MKKLLKKLYAKIFQTETINYKNKGIISLIDVGAIGKLPSPWLKNSNYIKNLLRFEPRESNSNSNNVQSLDIALGSKNEIRDFYIYKGNKSQGSSLYKQNFKYVNENFHLLKGKGSKALAETWHERSELIRTVKVNVKTLDSILKKIKVSYDFLKIDAQGAEYEILLGSENYLKNDCLGLQLELFEIPLYEGIKLKSEVIKFLKKKGFNLVKELPHNGTFESSRDCIFIKQNYDIKDSKKIEFIKKLYQI
jgi:FkbM family methyltransferase